MLTYKNINHSFSSFYQAFNYSPPSVMHLYVFQSYAGSPPKVKIERKNDVTVNTHSHKHENMLFGKDKHPFQQLYCSDLFFLDKVD